GERCTVVFAGAGFAAQDPDRFEMSPARAEDMHQLLGQALGPDRPPCRGVVHLWNLDAPAPEGLSADDLDAAEPRGRLSVAHLGRACNAAAGTPRLWLVTRGAQVVSGPGGPVALAQAPAWGLGRVLTHEVPQFRPKLVDLGHAAGAAETQALFE